jgi:hypothetical protein
LCVEPGKLLSRPRDDTAIGAGDKITTVRVDRVLKWQWSERTKRCHLPAQRVNWKMDAEGQSQVFTPSTAGDNIGASRNHGVFCSECNYMTFARVSSRHRRLGLNDNAAPQTSLPQGLEEKTRLDVPFLGRKNATAHAGTDRRL